MKKIAKASPARFLVGAMMVFFALAFARPVVLQEADSRLYLLAAAVPGVLLLSGSRWISKLLGQDRVLFVIGVTLCALGVLVLAQAERDLPIGETVQIQG